MSIKQTTSQKRERRHIRIRSKVSGTSAKPRLSVFRSNKFVYAQLIDDEAGKTLAYFCSKALTSKDPMIVKAKETGKKLAELALAKKISKVVFDRGGFVYTGKIQAIAEGAREGGLQF